jgi:long-chain acyl-CoA synthetase
VVAKNSLPFAEARGDDLAVADEFASVTFVQVNERVNRAVHALQSFGLGPGDRVALLVGNRHEALEFATAVYHAALVNVPINWHLAAEEVAYILDDSDARVILADAEHGDLAADAAARAQDVEHRIVFGGALDGFLELDEVLAAQSADEPEQQASGATMFYTSGTTGRPKGVVSSLLPIGADAAVVQMLLEGLGGLMQYPRDGRALVMAPVYHSGPFATAAIASALGNTLYFTRKFDPEEMLRLIDEHAITSAYAVPTFFTRLLKLPEDIRAKYDVGSVDYVWHTAAPCPREIKQQMMDWWGPVIHEGYGATEGSITVWATPEQWLEKPGTVGKIVPTVELLVVGDDGAQLGPGEVGQLYFRSLVGADFEYHKAPEKTQDVHLEPGVFTFGDVGYVDEDGFVFLSDRKIDMIISGGVNIYPAEIESVLVTHDAVADAAVFGIPNEDFGEEVKAVVELREGREATGALASELEAFCRDHLAGYKTPRCIDFTEELPRTETGKLVKRRLRDPYWESAGRTI